MLPLFGHEKLSAVTRMNDEHAPRPHRRAQRQIQILAAGQRVGAGAGRLRLVVRPLARPDVDREPVRLAGCVPDLFARVGHQDRDFAAKRAADEFLGRLDHVFGLQQARHVTRKFVQHPRTFLAIRRDARLIAQTRRHLAGDQRDDQHDGERQQVLEVADCERKAGRHEKEIERRDTDEGRQHRGTTPSFIATSTTASRNSITMLARSKTPCSGRATNVVAKHATPAHR